MLGQAGLDLSQFSTELSDGTGDTVDNALNDFCVRNGNKDITRYP